VRILVSKFGKVDEEERRRIVELMEECYGRLGPHKVELVDLYFFERSSQVDAFLVRESKEVGVVSAHFENSFFAMHDAWRGTSRIVLCVERLKALPRLVQEGGIRHEVGHSVLHGDLRYYILPVSTALLELTDRFDFPSGYATNLHYLVSIAVKDYEVSRLLTGRSYIEDQLAYARHLLTVSESERLSWQISRGEPLAEVMCLVSCLKVLSCAVPFVIDQRYSKEIEHSIRENLSYLPKKHSTTLLDLVNNCFPSLGMDTLSNIDCVVGLTAERIIKPILLRGAR